MRFGGRNRYVLNLLYPSMSYSLLFGCISIPLALLSESQDDEQ